MGGERGRLISKADRTQALELIHEACTAGARKNKACELLNVSLRTIERWEHEGGERDKRAETKHVPPNKLTLAQREEILAVMNSSKYQNLSPCTVVPLLADNDIYLASESTLYRILREEKQLTHRQCSKSPKHYKPKACVATGPNQVWSWDISYLPTQVRGLYYYLYMVVDIYSRKIVGWNIHDVESSEYGAALVKQACLDEGVEQNQLTLHSDNGSPMKGATMLAMLEKLGVARSFSRPSVSDDNPYSEALFKTFKYCNALPKLGKFEVIEDARKWAEDFAQWYNYEHLHSGLKFITPVQRHTRVDEAIMKNRHKVYQEAKQKFPERWSGKTRNWTLPENVTLNPDRKKKLENNSMQDDIMIAA